MQILQTTFNFMVLQNFSSFKRLNLNPLLIYFNFHLTKNFIFPTIKRLSWNTYFTGLFIYTLTYCCLGFS